MLCDIDFKEELQNWRKNRNLSRAAVFKTMKQSLVDRYLVLSIILSFVIVAFCVVDDKSILKVSDSIFFTGNLFKMSDKPQDSEVSNVTSSQEVVAASASGPQVDLEEKFNYCVQ